MEPDMIGKTIAIQPVGQRGYFGRVLHLLFSIRWPEVIVLQGTPIFGALFSMGRLSFQKVGLLTLLIAGSCCLVAHVFAFNDWSGVAGDLNDPQRSPSVFMRRGIRRSEIGYLSAVLMGFGILALIPLGATALAIGIGIILLSALYSAPGVHLKGSPAMNSVLHFAGGLLHFLMGYALFHVIDMRGVEIGAFFALTFAAGHLTHEVRDWEGDHINGIMTNAVRFGKTRALVASLMLFTAAYAILAALAAFGRIPHMIVWCAALYPLHLYWSIRAQRAGLTFAHVEKLRVKYRVLFLMIGVIILIALLPSIVR